MTISASCEYISRLSSIKGLGLKTFYHLYNYFGSVDAIANADHEQLMAAGLKASLAQSILKLRELDSSGSAKFSLDKQIAWSDQPNQHVLGIEDDLYPAMLKEVYCPPPIIYAKGHIASLALPSLAMVGSRKPSIAGKQHAFSFSRELSLEGFNIVSGLAIGVDTQAHQGALSASGLTCAVLGTGLDIVYPRQNIELAEQIIESGVLISEMALGSMPVPANFPRRNRLIAGLSQGVLIVEASLKSGSLITANYAIEQNRDLYVIPGPIDSAVSAGCNELIKQGAQLVTCVNDIVGLPSIKNRSIELADEAKASDSDKPQVPKTSVLEGLDTEQTRLLTILGYQCTSFDMLVNECGLDAGTVIQTLVSLELKGLISSVPGGYQRVKSVNFAD